MGAVFQEVKRVLKQNGHLWVVVGYSNVNPWVAIDIAQVIRPIMVLQNQFTWVKSIAIDGVQKGHYKPINSKRFANPVWEYVFHFTKTGSISCDRESIGVPYVYKCNIKRFSRNSDLHCAGNAWFIPYQTIVSKDTRGRHPATFPEELVERCIKFSGITTGTLLDPFMGTGTSGVAGIRCGLDVIGYDISKDYCSFSRSRISKEMGLDKFLSTP